MKQLLYFFFLFIYSNVQSQQLPTLTLDMADVPVEQKIQIPFAGVQVLDVRFDKSNVGCISEIRKANATRVKYAQAKALFPDSLHRYLPLLLQKMVQFNRESNDTLVLLIKQFRISDRIINSIDQQLEPEIFLRVSLSAYAKKESQLQRIFSVDDLLLETIPSDRILKPDVMDVLRTEALMTMLQKLLNGKSWQTNGSPFSLAAVEEGIQKRFQLPLFTDSEQRPGVYKTFQEFKQNRPSLLHVQFKINKNKLESITDSKGEPIDMKNYWGACTGQKRYIIFRNEWHELHNSDKGFYFLSFISRSELAGRPSFGDYAPQTGLLGAALLKGSENKSLDHWFFLNMDEETLYLEDVFGKSSLKQMEKELLK